MNELGLKILACQIANDHEVRILVDGGDWLGNDALGIDPPEFFAQPALLSEGELLVGRCDCGCVGCCDVKVDVLRTECEVVWSNPSGLRLAFDRASFDLTVATAREDTSWEDVRRTAERLVTKELFGTSTADCYTFGWASARIADGTITLSFNRAGDQRLYKFSWDGLSPESALENARGFSAGLPLLRGQD